MARILVIEDSKAVREAMVSVLTVIGGHEVTAATNGSEGLSMLARQAFDAAITDIWMPEEDGIGFLRRAKEIHPDMPVIVVTGGGPNFPPIELSVSVVESHGADAVFIKPFEDDQLLAAVTRLIPAGRS